MRIVRSTRHTTADTAPNGARRHKARWTCPRIQALGATGLTLLLSAAVQGAGPSSEPGLSATGSECLIGGSAVASGCVVTSQQPVLQIPGSGSGNVYISDGSSPDQSNAWVSPAITLSPNSACGGNTCYTVPAGAGLLPRHSYQWTFVPSGGGNNLTWQGFTIDYVRAAREPTDSFGPLTIGLASGTVQTKLQTQAVQTASGTVQIGLSYRSGYTGTPTGKPWFPEDPADSLPVGWVFTGVDANVPWVRISAVDGVGGSGTSAVTLQAFDGSLLEYTNTAGGSGGWAPPVGVGRPANDYGSLSQSTDGSTFTWTSGTSVVTFMQSASDSTVWLASSAQQILPGAGGKPSPGLQVSWDSQGRLASIADQSSIDSSGKPTRVAHFYYGGDSQCATQAPSGLVVAPSGTLCAFENLDGSTAQVYYYQFNPATSFGAYQIGQVALPGDATWSFGWQTASYTLTDNTTVTAPQLLSVQTPGGHDAASAGTVGTDDSKWWVVYDPFFGELQGFVSPLPGAGPAANDRLGRYYTLASGANPGEAQIAWGTVSGSAPSTSLSPGAQLQRARALLQRLGLASASGISPEARQRVRALLQRVGLGSASASGFSLSLGALLQRVGFDSAWRRTSVETFLDANTSYTTSYSWDPALDLQTGVTFAGVTETQAYDFLGRLKTKNGPGAAVSTYEYDQDSLAGWTATIYNNNALSAPGVTSEAVNSAAVAWTSAPAGVTSGTWSMRLSTYLEAPAAGASVAYRLSSDGAAAATLWVNGECDPAPAPMTEPPLRTGPPDQAGPGVGASGGCGSDNTATTSVATAAGDALNLVVQYVRGGTAVSAANPVSIQVEQQVNGGNWTTLALADLDPGLDLQSTAASSDTLSPGASAVTLARTTAWEDPLFGTQTGVAYPGFSGDLITTPGYEASYDPTSSQWKRLTSQTSAGGSTYGLGYWDNTATPTSPLCSDTEDVIQAGQVQTLTYPDPSSGAAVGLSRQLAYDAAGRKVAVEVLPAGVTGCLSYDARARKVAAQVSTYGGIGPLSEAWAYSPDGLTTTITHTFGAPAAKPACATESSAPYTCTESQTVDLLGRTVARTDVWGTMVATDYQLDPATGVQTTTTTTTTTTAATATTTRSYNRDGNPATLTRTDTAGSPTLSATWSYDSFGRTHSIETDSGTAEVITATYGYDDQSRVDSLAWSQNGSPVVTNSLTLSPNSTRTLGETIGVGGKTYDFAYSFNTAGWLTGAELTGGLSAAWDYGFDSATLGTNLDAQLNGNVTSYTATVGTNKQTLDLGYDYLDRIGSTSATSTIAHDALGNLTGYGNLQLTYNQTDQLIDAADGTTTVSFDRTPNGDLYRKVTSNGTPTAIRYAAGNLILNDSGTATFQTLLIGNLLATIDLADSSQSGYTLTTLQGGNALLTLDATGSPQNLSSPSLYGPWGEVINPPTADPAKPLYGWQAGTLLETTAGLVLMGERTYLPALGRFTSLDPAFGGGINGYNYAANDPINNNDPNGRLSQSTKNTLEIGGVVGGGVVGATTVGVVLYKLFAPSEPIAQANAPELNVGASNLEGTAEGTADVVDLNIAGNEINQLSEGVNDPALEASDGMFEGLQGGVDDAFLEALEAGGLL